MGYRIKKGEAGKIQPGVTRGDSGLFHAQDEAWEPDALDLDILRILPDEGSMRGRYLQDTMSVAQIRKTLDPTLTPYYLSYKLRNLWDQGLAVKQGTSKGAKTALGWQRTAAGKRLATAGTIAEEGES